MYTDLTASTITECVFFEINHNFPESLEKLRLPLDVRKLTEVTRESLTEVTNCWHHHAMFHDEYFSNVFLRRNEVKYAIFYSLFKREQQIYFLKSFIYQINSFLNPEWNGINDESIISSRSVIHTIKALGEWLLLYLPICSCTYGGCVMPVDEHVLQLIVNY